MKNAKSRVISNGFQSYLPSLLVPPKSFRNAASFSNDFPYNDLIPKADKTV